MLTKRTNILFDKELWNALVDLAKKQNTSIGKLVRTAVKEKYQKEQELEQRKGAIEYILKHRKIFKGKIDYKSLINTGRKF